MSIDVVIDLSRYNGAVDFARVKAARIAGVIGKATQGLDRIDPMFAANMAGAQAAGLLWGAYHFGVNADGAAQADYFLATAGHDVLHVLDYEPNRSDATTMTLDQAKAFVTRIHDVTGVWPGLYTGALARQVLGGRKDPVLANCWLWLAQYASKASVPPTWSTWTMWQYTDSGAVSGVPGHVDRSRFHGDLPALKRLWGVGR